MMFLNLLINALKLKKAGVSAKKVNNTEIESENSMKLNDDSCDTIDQ